MKGWSRGFALLCLAGCDLVFRVEPGPAPGDGGTTGDAEVRGDGASTDAIAADAPVSCPGGGVRMTEHSEAIAEVAVPRNSNGPFGCLDVVNAGVGIDSGGLFRFVHPILAPDSIVGYRLTFPFADGDRVECSGGPCLGIEAAGPMALHLVDRLAPDWIEALVKWTTPGGTSLWGGDGTLGAHLTASVAVADHDVGVATTYALTDPLALMAVQAQVDGNDHLEVWITPAPGSSAVAVISAKEGMVCQAAPAQARAVLETFHCPP